MKYQKFFEPMNVLENYKELQGKKIVYVGTSGSASEASNIVFVTEDGSVLLIAPFEENNELVISPLSERLFQYVVAQSTELRHAFSKLGYFNNREYNIAATELLNRQIDENDKRKLAQERAEYERLKVKFETNGDA